MSPLSPGPARGSRRGCRPHPELPRGGAVHRRGVLRGGGRGRGGGGGAKKGRGRGEERQQRGDCRHVQGHRAQEEAGRVAGQQWTFCCVLYIVNYLIASNYMNFKSMPEVVVRISSELCTADCTSSHRLRIESCYALRSTLVYTHILVGSMLSDHCHGSRKSILRCAQKKGAGVRRSWGGGILDKYQSNFVDCFSNTQVLC